MRSRIIRIEAWLAAAFLAAGLGGCGLPPDYNPFANTGGPALEVRDGLIAIIPFAKHVGEYGSVVPPYGAGNTHGAAVAGEALRLIQQRDRNLRIFNPGDLRLSLSNRDVMRLPLARLCELLNADVVVRGAILELTADEASDVIGQQRGRIRVTVEAFNRRSGIYLEPRLLEFFYPESELSGVLFAPEGEIIQRLIERAGREVGLLFFAPEMSESRMERG